MLIINFMNFEGKGATKAYIFTSSIFYKSFITSNISIFENLNIIQIKINKIKSYWGKWLTI